MSDVACGYVSILAAVGRAPVQRVRGWGRQSACRVIHRVQARTLAGGFLVSKRQRQNTRGTDVVIGSSVVPTAPSPVVQSSKQLSPSDLAAAIRAAARGANAQDLRMWRNFAQQVLFHAGSLSAKQMAFITNGFAHAGVPDRDVFRRLADRAIDLVSEFEPRDSALLLNAYARLEFRDHVLFEGFAKVIRADVPDGYGEQQLSLIANAFARLEIRDVALFQTLGKWIIDKSSELTAQAVATVANAYGKVSLHDPAMFSALAADIERHLSSFSSQHLSSILNAYAKLQVDEPDMLERIVEQVPSKMDEFGPVDLATTALAISKMNVSNRKLLLSLTAAVRQNGPNFRARQLANVLHAFSMMPVSSRGGLLTDMGNHVVQNVDMADDQSLVLLFCAYARAGQPHSQVVTSLRDRLYSRVSSLETQAIVNLFYACGRLGFFNDIFAKQLAGVLAQHLQSLLPQHVSNCLYALSRIGARSEEFTNLLQALQLRAIRGDMQFEPQHLANILHALAGLHGSSDSNLTFSEVVHAKAEQPLALATPMPGMLVPSLVARTLKYSRWGEQPQLLVSIVLSCARLGQGSAPLFALASDVVQLSEVALSKKVLADLLAAFASSQFFDLGLFSHVLAQYSVGGVGTASLHTTLSVLGSLHYASCVFAASEDLTKFPEALPPSGHHDLLLFPECPLSFQKQVRGFFEAAGFALLARAESVAPAVLWSAAAPFAHARLFSCEPFDLLSPESRAKAASLADMKPASPLQVLGFHIEASPDDLFAELGSESSAQPLSKGSLLDMLVGELQAETIGSTESADPTASARRLAKYAGLLRQSPAAANAEVTVPAAVLDPLIVSMSAQFVDSAPALSFEAIATILDTLAEVGICPRVVLEALVVAAESRFPRPLQTFGKESFLEAASVASFFRGLRAVGAESPPALRQKLLEYTEELSDFLAPSMKSGNNASESFQLVISLLSALRMCDALDEKRLRGLLTLVLYQLLDEAALHSRQSLDPVQNFTTLAALIDTLVESKLDHPLVRDASWVIVFTILQLQSQCFSASPRAGGRTGTTLPSPLLLDLLKNMGDIPMGSFSGCHLQLLTILAHHLGSNSQSLKPFDLVSCFEAFTKVRLWSILENNALTDSSKVEAEAYAAIDRCRQFCGLEALGYEQNSKSLMLVPRERLPQSLLLLLRSLLSHRRLSPTDAARSARFCALALDAAVLSEAGKAEALKGLAHLMERLCWERQLWSTEDCKLITGIAMLLRSEFPELLRGSQFSRRVLLTLEEMRG